MLQDYLRELSHVRVLEHEEELSHWKSYKEKGASESRRTLIESYQPLVFKLAMQFNFNEVIVMDLIQEGTVGLIEATENYDHRKGVAFSLYAQHRIRGRMLNYLQSEGRKSAASIEQPLFADDEEAATLKDTLVDATVDIATSVGDYDLFCKIKQAMDRLPVKEQLVLSGVYLEDQEHKDLASSLNLSLSHVYRLQKQGVRRLRGMLSKVMAELKR